MLKNKVSHIIEELVQKQQTSAGVEPAKIGLFKEEKEYTEKFNLLTDDAKGSFFLVEKDPALRFAGAYIERCDKETEQLLSNEGSDFLSQPIGYLKKHPKEFLYLESEWLNVVETDSISIEVDDVFGTYDVMLGLKLLKKYNKVLKEHLTSALSGNDPKFDLLFNSEDGLWDLNFPLNHVKGYHDQLSINEAFMMIYQFLFKLLEEIEENA